MSQTYTQAAQALIGSGLPSTGLIALSRGFGPVPCVDMAKLENPAAQLLDIAAAFDAEVQ
jgi:hypothetical protein